MTISMADLQWMGRGDLVDSQVGCRAPPPPAGAATQSAGRVRDPAAPEAQLHAPTVTPLVQSREGVARAVCDQTVTFTRPLGPIRPDGPVDRLCHGRERTRPTLPARAPRSRRTIRTPGRGRRRRCAWWSARATSHP